MPAPERAGKDRDGRRRPLERRRAGGVRVEAIRIGAPLDAHDLSRRRVPWQNRGARRHDEIGARADALAPPAHRFDDERAIETRLGRTGMIDDRRVHFEHRPGADRGRRHHAFAAEVVVALDDDRRLQRGDEVPDRAGAHPAQLLGAKRRRHRNPADGIGRGRGRKRPVTRRDEHVDLVPQGREPLGHRRHVDRSAGRAGHGLVDGAVENPHGSGNGHGSGLDGLEPRWPGLVFSSNAKNGPDVMRPKSSRSSFIANDSAAQHAVGRGAARDLCLGRRSRFAHRARVDIGGADAGLHAPGRALRHRPLGHAHQDVLDEPADDRRVERDALDAESARVARRVRDRARRRAG